MAAAASGTRPTIAGVERGLPSPLALNNLGNLHAAMAAAQGSGGGTTTVSFFGPEEYVRTTGNPNTYVTTVQVPAWVTNPFNLHIQNGEADGSFRVSSAVISINNTQAVAAPSDFDQNVFTIDRSVTLTPTTTLTVTLASKPGSYLRINLSGASGDKTPPVLTINAPAAAINTPQAHFDIHYQDLPGAGETVASGVNTATLSVLLDGVDRTSLFTRFPDEAIADLPASLALSQGPHNLSVSVQDNAGNTGSATEQFQVDTTPPVLQVVQPAAGRFLNNTSPQIVLAYSDNFALNLGTLKVTDNGADITAAFTKTATGASGTPTLSQGGNEIVATISDQAGNQAKADVVFNVDTTPPVITIVHPENGSKHGSTDVEFLVLYSDDQAIDLTSLVVTVDGGPVPVTPTATEVSGSLTLGNSASHVLTATIKDKAGNSASASSTFVVDTTVPNIHIVQPPPGAILNSNTPQIQVEYNGNASGVDTTTFAFSIDGISFTNLFSVGATSATATLRTALTDGTHILSAQIASGAGNTGSVSDSILIDTIKPSLTIVSPAGAVNTATPLGLAQYSDSGSGIDPTSVKVTLDGVDVTGTFAVGSSSVTGALGAGSGLSETTHQFAVQVADKAGNLAQASSSFLVDITPPTVAFSSPANDSFTNNTQPAITLTYSDSGSGVDFTSIHIFLQQGNAPETEITPLFAITATQATATIPTSSALVPGTYHLRAVVADKAGNTAPAQSTFGVDTAPPTYNIVSPAANAFLNTSTPNFDITYTDDLSGVDPSKFVLLVDGVDRTNRLTFTAAEASGSLQAGDALADGTHQFSVTVVDRAGNAAPVVPQSFLVDTIAPTLAITTPQASTFTNNSRPAIAVTYSDSGSGVDTTTFHLLVDGTDVTSQFTVTATGATGSLTTALLDGPHTITANIRDFAGNPATATTLFAVDTTPLTLTLTQPTNGTFTNATSIAVSGAVTGFSPVTVTVEGTIVPVTGGAFTTQVPLGPGPSQVIHVSASDPSGASTSTTVSVAIDRVNPTIVASLSPPANPAGWNNTNVTVSFVCADDNSGVASCTGPTQLTNEGAHQTVTGTAVDRAGNTTSTSVTVNIDRTPPVITATAAPPPNANGWNNSNVTVTFVCTDNLSGVASCPPTTVVATEGQNQPVPGQATDVAGNVAQTGITLSIDKTPPTIVQLSTPDHISATTSGLITVTVTDNFTVAQVVISVNGTSLGTFTTPPYQATLTLPAGANPGDTLTVTAVATDEAGNTQTASRGVSVTTEGVIVGQVLSDATGLPVQGAAVQLISSTGQASQTDQLGRYSFQANDSHLFLSATNTGTTTVEREIFVQPGAGTVAVDARLTPLAAAVPIGSAGGTLTAGPISISVPAASVSSGTSFQLTPLSGQGLPGLLPLGWGPLAAFDLRATSSFANLLAMVSQLPNVAMNLAVYDSSLHAWTLLASSLQAVNGASSFTVPAAGSYALVIPDTTTPPIVIPAPGSPLTGIAVQAIDPAATSTGSLNPAMLPPSGGTAVATLGLQSPSFAPSGTPIQANVTETYTLSTGDVVSEETRSEDILLYNSLAPANSAMGAVFPVTPSQQYTVSQLVTGNIHLDLLAGREGVRGQPGGNDPLTISDGIATLAVPGGALAQDTAISVQATALENFVPTSTTMAAVQEVLVDFSGQVLNTPAQLSISSSGLNPRDTFLLTQVQRINGVPHFVTVALAQISGNNLTSMSSPALPGVTQGGEYVFYDISAPAGFVQGVTSSRAGPIPALVLSDSLQIASISGANGKYFVPALVGTANLKASAPNTSLVGTASATVVAGQTVTQNILLTGTVTTASVTPADGTLGVPAGTIITITTSAPINPQSIVQSNLSLVQGPSSAPGTPVALQPFILSTSGTKLTFAPVSNLASGTQYTVSVSGLADVSGGAIAVPTSSFTTQATAPLSFNPNAITFAFPDQNGNIHVSAPAGSLPAGTKVLIIDQTSAVVLSLTVLNDGSLSGDFPGTINDILQVTLTDPNGATATFTQSQFVAADGSVAVGPGGGTVSGPGGVSLIIPAGALSKGVKFTIASFGPDEFPERPNVPGGTFGGGLKLTADQRVTFNQEAKLAFPMPSDAPPGAFFQVYGRLQLPDGSKVAFEDLDYAKPQGTGPTAQVVTASFPFRGMIGFNFLMDQADFEGQALDINPAFGAPPLFDLGLQEVAFIIWTANQLLPGIALGGAVTGRVRYAIPAGAVMPNGSVNTTGDTVFVGVPNVLVTLDAPTHALSASSTVARTQPDGTFTFSDPAYNGGTVNVIAMDENGHGILASAVEVVSITDKDIDVLAGPLLPFYHNVAFADFVLPAPVPPPPTPQIGINLFTQSPSSTPPGLRVPVNGIVTSGTALVVALKTNGQIPNPPTVTINGTPFASQPDQPTVKGDPNTLDFELSQPFVPGTPGIYTLTVTGLTAFAVPVTASKSFMVIAPGGSNNNIQVGVAPVIASVTPATGATGVQVNTFIQVQFNEPVTNLAGHVSLVPGDGTLPPALKLSGVDYRDGVTVIPSLSATDAVASMTIEPLTGLKFNTTYTVTITTDPVNLDNVADPTKTPLHFVPPEQQSPPVSPYTFTTFGPQVLGGTTQFSSTRAVVMGERAYVATSNITSLVETFDISDPANPTQIASGTTSFIGRAFDLAGEENAAVLNGGNLLGAVAGMGGEGLTIPSNLWLYNVSGDQMTRVGAVSVSSSVDVGQATRLAIHGNFAYTYVDPVGIAIVDLAQALSDYANTFPTNPTQFGVAVSTGGEGFANDAVINSIPVKDPTGNNVLIEGLKAGDFLVAGSDPANPVTQTFVIATGTTQGPASATPISFVVVDPTQPGPSAVVYSGLLQLGASKLTFGMALALGQLTDSVPDANGNPVVKQVAIVVGDGIAPDPNNPGQTTAAVLAVVDTTVPSSPAVLSMIGLPAGPSDVLLNGTTAIVGTYQNEVLLVSLVDPRNPQNSGTIVSSSFGDKLALGDNGLLVGTSIYVANGGIHTAVLGSYIVIQQVSPSIANVNDSGNTTEPIQVTLNAHGQTEDLTNAQIIYSEDGTQKAVISVGNLHPGVQTVTIPAGLHVSSPGELVEVALVRPDGTETPSIVLPLNSQGFAASSSSSSTSSSGQSGGAGQSAGQSNNFGLPVGLPGATLPSFAVISPTQIQVGSGDTVVTVTGTAAAGLTAVFVRGLDSQWNSLTATPSSSGGVQFTVPASLLSQAGFLEVATAQDDASSIPLMVYDPNLPPVGSAGAQIDADFADVDTGTLLPDTIVVIGTNFVAGSSIVIGRGTTPGTVLPTNLLDSNTLEGSLSSPFALNADDLFVAVLSADGTVLSNSLPLPRASVANPIPAGVQALIDPVQPVTSMAAGVDPLEVASTNQFQPTDIGITSVQGNLNATVGASVSQQVQTLLLCGVNLVDGLVAKFRTTKGGVLTELTSPLYGTQTVATMPSSDPNSPPQSPVALMCSNVDAPKAIPDTPVKNLQPKADHALGGSATEDFRQAAVIAFGGVRQFGVYQDRSGNNRILSSSEANSHPEYQLLNNAVLSIADPGANNGHNTIQLERESGDTLNTGRIRATALSVLPCDKIQKEVTNPPQCNTATRSLPQLQAVLSGNVLATRNVESKFGTLGNGTKKSHPEYDATISYYADLYGIPPHFLKAQAIQESIAYSGNFRFEFTSINVSWLSGDGDNNGAFSGSRPLIQTSPFSLYLIQGSALRSYRPGTNDASGALVTRIFPFQDPTATQFNLGVSVKRKMGRALGRLDNCGRNECPQDAAVHAWIQTQNGANVRQLTLVHRDTIWQRNCLNANGSSVGKCSPTPALVNPGVDSLPAGQNTLQPTEFAVNYSSGLVTLGAPLAQGQRLKITYWPVGTNVNDGAGQPSVVSVNAGQFASSGTPNLNDPTVIKQADKKIRYNPGELLFDFLKNNVANDYATKPFLTTVTARDNFVEFTVDANNQPVQPRDPRYQFMTSQPYASSSYGFLQLTLLPFGPGSQFTKSFDPSSTPIYQLLTAPGTNFDLAAHYHLFSFNSLFQNSPAPCSATCNESLWEQEWTKVFGKYNAASTYGSGIIHAGVTTYSPSEPQ